MCLLSRPFVCGVEVDACIRPAPQSRLRWGQSTYGSLALFLRPVTADNFPTLVVVGGGVLGGGMQRHILHVSDVSSSPHCGSDSGSPAPACLATKSLSLSLLSVSLSLSLSLSVSLARSLALSLSLSHSLSHSTYTNSPLARRLNELAEPSPVGMTHGTAINVTWRFGSLCDDFQCTGDVFFFFSLSLSLSVFVFFFRRACCRSVFTVPYP